MLPILLVALAHFDAPVGTSLEKLGWTGDTQHAAIVAEKGETFVRSHYVPDGEANYIRKEVHWDTRELPILQWRWRANHFPKGAKILEPAKSDAAAQVYVLWRSFPKSYVLKYFWASDDAVGTVLRQSVFLVGALWGMVLRSGPAAGWVTERRNLPEDFRAAFDRDPPGEALGIALLADGDETKSEAEADFAAFEALEK